MKTFLAAITAAFFVAAPVAHAHDSGTNHRNAHLRTQVVKITGSTRAPGRDILNDGYRTLSGTVRAPTSAEVQRYLGVLQRMAQPVKRVVYHAPVQHAAPVRTYVRPQPTYQAPRVRYQAPRRTYTAPRRTYTAPQRSYTAPRRTYTPPQRTYTAPQRTYTQSRSYSGGGAGGNLARIRSCESGSNYSANTGNGFYGAYQFTQSTWHSVGGSGNPASASPAEQDHRAAILMSRSGAGQWPVCGR